MTTAPFHIVLIGHRGSGKTALGRMAAERLGMRFADVDDEIEQSSGTTAAELVAANEERFRKLELEALQALLAEQGPLIIATGGGIRIGKAVQEMKALRKAFIISIEREGWDDVARTQRARLRPEMEFEDERAWMVETREPGYAAAADATVHIERDTCEATAAGDLVRTIERLYRASSNDTLKRTWVLARSTEELRRAERLATLFPLAGVEIRSDLPTADMQPSVPYLTSLRTPDRAYLRRHQTAAAIDIDVEYIDIVDLVILQPRPLILSCHPMQPEDDVIDMYRYLLHRVAAMFPDWIDHLQFKYAPVIQTWDELEELLTVEQRMKLYAESVTGDPGKAAVIPQGERWRWVRALLMHRNGMNYVLPPGSDDENVPPPLEYLLPFAGTGPHTRRYGVIGDPVEHSIGDVWHMDRNIEAELNDVGYYRIPVKKDELDEALRVLHMLGFKGLSVTAPLKRAVLKAESVTNPASLEAGNTLTRTSSGWALDDRDVKGMDAVLAELGKRGIAAGTAVVFGAGGVSPAVLKSLANNGWETVSVSARDGWASADLDRVDLIINAAGPLVDAQDGAPAARAWIDLHYRDNAPPPEGTDVYLTGRTFYEAQAHAQRKIWGLA